MFTGIITGQGTVIAVEALSEGARLRIRLPDGFPRPSRGDSVAIDGACLTAVELAGDVMQVEAIAETLRKTTTGGLRPGRRVNLESALAIGDRLAGHWVQGHVDGTAELRDRRREGISERFELELEDPALARYVVPKGSIAVAGVSLTVGEVSGNRFAVYLIPHTLAETTLGELAVGGHVNIEVDILAKYVAHLLSPERALETRDATPALAQFLRSQAGSQAEAE